ncbi:MAG TPA: glycosyltransferase family 4 protein [Chitinophagaceae bacterium]
MKSRVLFIMQLPPPYHGASMANECIANSHLIKDSFNISIIDIKTSNNLHDLGKFSVRKITKSIALAFKILFRLLSFKPRVVHFTLAPSGFAFYRDAAYVFIIKLFTRNLVLHLHGKGFQNGIENSKPFKYFSKKIFKNSYCIHLSETLQKDVPDLHVKKRFLIPYGVPVVKNNFPEKNDNSTIRLLTISNYVRSKGILDIIDAVEIVVKTHTQFHVRLVGKPYDLDIKYLNNYVSERNLANFISITGPKYGNEKFEELNNGHIFILPTYYPNEAFPVSLLEALQFGLPCITTPEGGIPDMIEDGFTGFLVAPKNKEQLADRILQLLQNEQMRNTMSANTKLIFEEKYTLEKFEKNIVMTIKEILAEK